ncbi:Cellulose biosynthesis protein BcsQ (plasmid) [Nostoc flagelliforme CCNUN1]|uniref:Cellulose biosynthesis protein BcsQ n=1 Tax=Nostoc flagelliforme CCNUN1 TaxID=2038116 RepID=A0A2K8T5G8_9NOSO|nr:ParA family protein [Nostoc flagelliforme]AUB42968.1 Cellulose biosynthesis protein BcsQ [Nostoc flagelliforme CCNUN1]
MENKSYVIWNNKGGVGKSTITFHVASAYAAKNPDRDIVVIDMCPQANVSMILLGGGKIGETNLQSLISQSIPKTVVGYITNSILGFDVSNLQNYIIKISDENKYLPENMYLLSGDGNLELIAPLLSERANAIPLSENDKPWEKIHSIIKSLTKKQINSPRPCTFFIDTNPSFSVYTQIAILAGEYLLVPINADDSSIFAITGLFNLIWGTEQKHPVYGKYTFASKANDFSIERPKISLLLGNRFTQKTGTAWAFKAVSNEAIKKMYEQYEKYPNRFIFSDTPINNQTDFESSFSFELRDFNSAGVVAANQGMPLSKMIESTYEVYDEKSIQVSLEQRKLCRDKIDDLVKKL